MIIHKKILPEYFKAVQDGSKTFEIRTDDDGVKAGDMIVLEEWENGHYTGNRVEREITYVLRNCPQYGLDDGYCIMAIKPLDASVGAKA